MELIHFWQNLQLDRSEEGAESVEIINIYSQMCMTCYIYSLFSLKSASYLLANTIICKLFNELYNNHYVSLPLYSKKKKSEV